MFCSFFERSGIQSQRYDFVPFDINHESGWQTIDRSVPQLVNTYSYWSERKRELFLEHGCTVIGLKLPRLEKLASSTVRELISQGLEGRILAGELLKVGFMEEAIPGLFEVLVKGKMEAEK